MKKIPIFALLLLICTQQGISQNWSWKAALAPVHKTEYYNVFLPANVTCKLKPNYGNLRLLDENGNEVPYLFFSEKQIDQQVSLNWYQHLKNDISQLRYSRSYFSNPKANRIDRIVLKVRNADVKQTFWLSGSDDMKHWYIIKEDFAYHANYDPNSSYNLLTLSFPPVNYKYYKVEVRHRWREPIQILGAGYYTISETKGNYQHVAAPEISQNENQHKSEVEIHFTERQYVDRLFFEIDGPEMYLRQAKLQKRVGSHFETLQQFKLSSRELNLLEFDALRVKDLRLVIENHDDRPLQVAAVQALQLRKYLTAKLEKGATYSLHLGQEGLRKAEYDLQYFTKDLPTRRTEVALQELVNIHPNPNPKVLVNPASPPASPATKPLSGSPGDKKAVAKPFLEDQVYLWGGIILIIVLLGLLSFRMLRDLDNPKDSEN